MSSIVIIIVCYNSNYPLNALTKSINGQSVKPSMLILVDNAPISNPVSKPDALFPVVILPGKEGDGFGKGCNTGLDYLQKRNFSGWVWLLNPDTYLKTKCDIETLLCIVNTHDPNTLIGTAIENEYLQLEQSAGWIQKGLGYRKLMISHEMLIQGNENVIEVDWVSGCNLIFRPLEFNNMLRFDAHFPLYFEDIDFCLRSTAHGGKCIWITSLRISHQKSTGSLCSSFRRERLKTISQIRFLRRYQSYWVMMLHTLRIIILSLIRLPIQFNASHGVLVGALQALFFNRHI